MIWLIGAHAFGWTDVTGRDGGAFGSDFKTTALMILSGPIATVLPFILYSHGTQHTHFATSGLIFYINPTLQFLVAIFVFGEVLIRWQEIAFPLLWVGLLIYSLECLRLQRAQRLAGQAPSPALHPFHPGRM
jgi:chloramphenicol-sensitive protein RarD